MLWNVWSTRRRPWCDQRLKYDRHPTKRRLSACRRVCRGTWAIKTPCASYSSLHRATTVPSFNPNRALWTTAALCRTIAVSIPRDRWGDQGISPPWRNQDLITARAKNLWPLEISGLPRIAVPCSRPLLKVERDWWGVLRFQRGSMTRSSLSSQLWNLRKLHPLKRPYLPSSWQNQTR